MRRLSFSIVALVAVLSLSACASATAPSPAKGEWMPDGTWCSGYVNPAGLCEGGGL